MRGAVCFSALRLSDTGLLRGEYMTVVVSPGVASGAVQDDEPFHPMEVAYALAGMFESRHHRIKTRCICGRTESPANTRCPGNCSVVTITNIHVDNSGDHLLALGESFAWKTHIADFRPVPTDYGWQLNSPGQPLLAIEL